MRFIPSITCLVASFFISHAYAIEASSLEASTQPASVSSRIAVTHYYRNQQYGFGVPMLPGVQAVRDAEPNPNHGLVYLLGPQRTISVSAAYDAADYGSSKIQLDHFLTAIGAKSAIRSTTKLAGKAAEQATITKDAEVTLVIAQRREVGMGIMYELVLTTNLTNQAKDSAAFQTIAARFKTFPLPR